jgi:hypothetical protein
VESVRVACSERLKQLVLELEYVQHTEEANDSAEYYDERVLSSPSSCKYYANYDATGDDEEDNSRWYDRVLRYLNGSTDNERMQKDDEVSYYAHSQPHCHSPRTTTRYDKGRQRSPHERHPPLAHAATSAQHHCGLQKSFI